MGQPRCPIDQLPMESALLAVPTDEVSSFVMFPNVDACYSHYYPLFNFASEFDSAFTAKAARLERASLRVSNGRHELLG
jgi:hypothetical protein